MNEQFTNQIIYSFIENWYKAENFANHACVNNHMQRFMRDFFWPTEPPRDGMKHLPSMYN